MGKPAERFLDCVAAVPQERDKEKAGRHAARNDTLLLAVSHPIDSRHADD